jgi:predicted esterase YcpF (UPF0227 family)
LNADTNCEKYLGENTNRHTGKTYNLAQTDLDRFKFFKIEKDRHNLPISAIVASDDDIVAPLTVEETIGSERCKIMYTKGGHQLENDEWLDMIQTELHFIW